MLKCGIQLPNIQEIKKRKKGSQVINSCQQKNIRFSSQVINLNQIMKKQREKQQFIYEKEVNLNWI